MKKLILALAASAALLGCQQQSATQAAAPAAPTTPPPPVTDLAALSFTPEQQADIRAVVRDYLVRDPTVLREALDQLQAVTVAERRHEIENDPRAFSIGPATAPITLVEFFDYRCGYCHAAMPWLLNLIDNRNDVRVVFREYPVLSAESVETAKAALAAQRQGKYLQFHQAVMGFRGDLTSQQIDVLARQAGVDVARMRRDMQREDIETYLQRNHELAADSGANGTPAFMINGQWLHGYDEARLNDMVREAARGGASQQRTR